MGTGAGVLGMWVKIAGFGGFGKRSTLNVQMSEKPFFL
jgi:hypothetical protein